MATTDLPPLPASPSPTPRLACADLSSGYLGKKVLDGVSFSVEEPAIYVVLGPNGAGKTTLFRTMAGILTPYRGSVEIGGRSIEQQATRDRLHFLSHVDGIPDGLTVEEALEFYAAVQRASHGDVDRVLGLLEIETLRAKFFSELSAGQKKRVSIARIFLKERDIYLLDEPTANLDPKVATEIRDLVLKLSRDRIVLYSSHNLFEAREIGRYVIALKNGRLALFGRIADLRSARYTVGIRATKGEGQLPSSARKGDYFIFELAGPEEVPKLLKELEGKGVQIREVKEMSNPLEDLFT
ncbi:MAG: heme ABC exporter ATP-binding protein CcmA [Euryarchaeota archaeon]|nr:heme ABC exporter ATP-binding protein CcmA [Euryarchaeota archaeon]MDE1835676.1 heme ABC exporter ATP-binding protein CcmA [Euryarchaeota archaeon]MDE2046658.1 heme ABC exporter ATP-binding protein CcmA [Thermoplasmata archaeon]